MSSESHHNLSAGRASPRSDGEASRERLMRAGLRLFAQRGFAGTSTREIALAAEVNVASISYYFGDKAGLYRAVFFGPACNPGAQPVPAPDGDGYAPGIAPAGGTGELAVALRRFYLGFLEPLAEGEEAQLRVKLRMREMFEPTGLWDLEVANDIVPMHGALVGLLCRHLGLVAADDDVHRLAICLTALGVHLHVGHDIVTAIAPHLHTQPGATRHWGLTLERMALAMVEAEAVRRRAPCDGTAPDTQPHTGSAGVA